MNRTEGTHGLKHIKFRACVGVRSNNRNEVWLEMCRYPEVLCEQHKNVVARAQHHTHINPVGSFHISSQESIILPNQSSCSGRASRDRWYWIQLEYQVFAQILLQGPARTQKHHSVQGWRKFLEKDDESRFSRFDMSCSCNLCRLTKTYRPVQDLGRKILHCSVRNFNGQCLEMYFVVKVLSISFSASSKKEI